MSKVRTFSRTFPKYHFRSGKNTFFVEQILNSFDIKYLTEDYYNLLLSLNKKALDEGKLSKNDIKGFFNSLSIIPKFKKNHTLRKGKHFLEGDCISMRVWSGNPYFSPQIIFMPDVKIEKIYDVDIYPTYEIYIDGLFFGSFASDNCKELAKNDGLTLLEFTNWFNSLPFTGQIICWKPIDYFSD